MTVFDIILDMEICEANKLLYEFQCKGADYEVILIFQNSIQMLQSGVLPIEGDRKLLSCPAVTYEVKNTRGKVPYIKFNCGIKYYP